MCSAWLAIARGEDVVCLPAMRMLFEPSIALLRILGEPVEVDDNGGTLIFDEDAIPYVVSIHC